MAQLHDHTIRLYHFVGIARPEQSQTRYRAQRGELFHRLVRRTVLAIAHRIVREHEDRRKLHQRRQPDRWAAIVAEDEERGTERA